MNQRGKRIYLINKLIKENADYDIRIPEEDEEQKFLLRALMNVRRPGPISDRFLKVQDEYLKEEIKEKGIVTLDELKPIVGNIYLWQGDITRLKVDAIVNAANSGMTGCYHPNHNCIDNCIHTYSGVQLRDECNKIMELQGHKEPTGQAKITNSYNLPCNFIIHTVGPIIYDEDGIPTKEDYDLLKSSYESCLKLAYENNLESIAFCCISTGEFRFPNDLAAKIAIDVVDELYKETNSDMKVIFNVFKDIDFEIYNKLLMHKRRLKLREEILDD